MKRHPKAKLTEADVRAIRASTAQGHILAERFGIHRETVRMIRTGVTWQHVFPKIGVPWDVTRRSGPRKRSSARRVAPAASGAQ
jgi:hypothetical protein